MTTKKATEPVAQLATRVPASLLKRLRIRCVQRQQTVQEFVREAIRERLRRVAARR
jgi:predicted HicB family RNase H-like nuclease